MVVIDQLLNQILSKPNMSGRMVKWVLELSEYDLGLQESSGFYGEGVSFGLQEAE